MQLMLVGGVLLLIDTFLHWQEVSAKLGGVTIVSAGVTAWHGFWGIIMCLALIVLLAWVVAKIAGVKIPLPVSDTMVAALLAGIVLLFALIKNLADDYSTKWSYIGIVLAAVVAAGAWMQVQAAGGVDTLRSEMSSMKSSDSPSTSPPSNSPPPAEPPASGPGETTT
jgi:energy-coupling factor transporter transmembrane protein EcfT